jgi:hypothetical protein
VRATRIVLPVVLSLICLSSRARADARDLDLQDENNPNAAAPPSASAGGPFGSWRGELKLGPSFNYHDFVNQFRIEAALGLHLADLGRHRLYAVLPVAIGFGNDVVTLTGLPSLQLGLGLFDIPLWLYVDAGVGVGVFFGSNVTDAALGLRFAVGAKYPLGDHWDVLFEPLDLEFYPVGFRNAVPVTHSIFVGIGYNM